MKALVPRAVLHAVATAVPHEYHGNLIVAGSLAAAYHFRRNDGTRTKDIDCVVSPRIAAVEAGREMAQDLIQRGWRWHLKPGFQPQDRPHPLDALPVIRLRPPDSDDWFIEFLTVPEDGAERLIPVNIQGRYFALATFEFLALVAERPVATDSGIRCARPEMMALANLLSHPRIAPARIEGLASNPKRSNKDLGRVLSLARLAGPDAVETWANEWQAAFETCFPSRWRNLAGSSGRGLEALLESEDDFLEAVATCQNGLLNHLAPTSEELRATARRVLNDAVRPLAARATA